MRQSVPKMSKIHQNFAFLFRKIFFLQSSIISDFQNFSENPMYKKQLSFCCCSGCSKGAHLPMIIWCLLLWAWFAQILMVCKNHGTQYRLNYPIVFGALLWGCSKGHTCKCLSIVCYHEPGWIRSCCVVENLGTHSFAIDVCWAGWGPANHQHMH